MSLIQYTQVYLFWLKTLLKKINFDCIESTNLLRYDNFMGSVPTITTNGFSQVLTADVIERRNASAAQHSLLGLGVHTRVRRREDDSLEVVVFKCTSQFCTRTQYLCDRDLCTQVAEEVQTRVASLYALQELEKTHVVFEEGFRKPIT
jgi:hypothetical protein